MNEFSLIDCYFKQRALHRPDLIFGIGDDAACLRIPAHQDLLVSTDTLVSGVHFLPSWDPYDIAIKAAMVNISDMAAMAAQPAWISLALTLPELNTEWLEAFSKGLAETLAPFNIALIGGDTTRGPLSITLNIMGLAPQGAAVRRTGAKPGDRIYLSGSIGAAALAVDFLYDDSINPEDKQILMKKLQHPEARVDFIPILRQYATSAIDISDGLSADLNHILTASGHGACLDLNKLPIHALVHQYKATQAIDFALKGGDDYELCYTIPAEKEAAMREALVQSGLSAHCIGVIEAQAGLRGLTDSGHIIALEALGYQHF